MLFWMTLACGTSTPTDTDTVDTDGADTDAADTDPVITDIRWSADCAWPDTLDASALVYVGEGADDETSGVSQVADAAAWDALRATWTFLPDEAGRDWANTDVVVTWASSGGSCDGVAAGAHGVSDGVVYARFDDPTGACEQSCDWIRSSVVAYAVPEGPATVCSRIVATCTM